MAQPILLRGLLHAASLFNPVIEYIVLRFQGQKVLLHLVPSAQLQLTAFHVWCLLSRLDDSLFLLQLTASLWTTEASTRERWPFGALTNMKATSSNRAPSTSSLYYY